VLRLGEKEKSAKKIFFSESYRTHHLFAKMFAENDCNKENLPNNG
jgi:hypothetical protein